MDTFPTGSSSRYWQWSRQTQKDIFLCSKLYLCLAQVLKMMVGNNLKDTQLQQVINSSYHLCTCRFLFKNWKKATTAKKMKALLCLSAIKLVSPFLDCGQDNSLPRQGQHRQDQLRGVLRGRFFLDVPISKSLQVVGNTDIHTKMVVEVWVGTFVSEDRCKMKQSFAQKWKQPH